MAEDREEGEAPRASRGASVEEGHFSNGLDGQISTIEDQLKRAEATLFDLQSLRGKLEAERQSNLRRAKEEQELRDSQEIRAENERLRRELKEYHSEIGSLKEIISSLKDNLVNTAEKLEVKVAKTLESLDKDEEKLEHKSHSFKQEAKHVVHKVHHREQAKEMNFFNDHLATSEAKPAEKPEAEAPPEAKVEAVATVTEEREPAAAPQAGEGRTSASESVQKAEPAPSPGPAKESAPAVAEEVATPVAVNAQGDESQPSMADTMLSDETKPLEVKAAIVSELDQTSQQLEEEALHDAELDEYEEIKRELEALENDAIFKPHLQEAAAPVRDAAEPSVEGAPVSPKAQPTQAAPVDIAAQKVGTEQKQSLITKLLHKKNKGKVEVAEAPPVVAAVAAEIKSEPTAAPAPAQPALAEAAPPPSPPEAPVEPAQAAQSEQTSSPAPAPAQPAVVAEPKEEVIREEAAEPKNKQASLSSLFKGKKRKIKGEVEDGRNDRPKKTGGGKLAIAAAVIVLLAGGTGLFFKLKNAEALRQMYISRAIENVNVASESSNKSEVPDEFSNLDPEKKYKEAYADLPFAETAWAPYADNEFGITIEYPKNTSYRLKPVGSNNIWFLRKNGYLLKIEKLAGVASIGEARDQIVQNAEYKSEEAVVRGNSTIHLVLEDDLPVKGNIYLTSAYGVIYKIWYKTYEPGENPDDEQRVKKMLDSLDFIPIR